MAGMQEQWNKISERIKTEISPANYKQWFGKTKLDETSDTTFLVKVPSAFIKEQLERRYGSLVADTIFEICGEQVGITYFVDQSLDQKTKPTTESLPEQEEESYDLPFMPQVSNPSNIGLSPKHTMDNFVVGFSNNLAYAAAQAVSQTPGTTYNPLFIYGGTGVGKTHLMQAVGNAILAKTPNIKIIYCTAERFTNDFIESIQNKKTAEFRTRYRSCNLLLIDDIQFISGRDSTQEEFFHTFNELHGKSVQVILTSDRPPNEIQKLEPRLASRFQGGLMVDIQNPDFDTRVAILRAKCQDSHESIPDDCLHFLAEHSATNARELEGKLIQIIQSAKLRNMPVTLEYVQSAMGATSIKVELIDSKKVMSTVNQYFNITSAELIGPRRNKEFVLPRQLVMYLLHEECKVPYEKIGGLLGGRDHTTILHGVEKIREVINRDREIQRMLIEIKHSLIA